MKSFFALSVALLTAPIALRGQDLGIAVGQKAPSAIVQGMDGRPVNLSTYIGKTPVLIEFWATWCSNCKHLEPSLLASQRKYGSTVRFVGVAVSVNQSPERVKQYVLKHGIKHDILFDSEGRAADAYDVPATSYIVVIDKKGTVVYTGLGGDQDLEAAIKKAL
jgi:peroxiredoxin